MRLAHFTIDGQTTIGSLRRDYVIDLAGVLPTGHVTLREVLAGDTCIAPHRQAPKVTPLLESI